MKNQRLLLFGFFLLLCVGFLHAQELKVSAFQRMDRDWLARTQERLDLNEVPCAIVRVSIPDAKSYTFEGNINCPKCDFAFKFYEQTKNFECLLQTFKLGDYIDKGSLGMLKYHHAGYTRGNFACRQAALRC